MDKEPLLEPSDQWSSPEATVPRLTENKKSARCLHWALYALAATYIPLLVATISLYVARNRCHCPPAPSAGVFPCKCQ